MTTPRDLLLALLAMDSYNRGYGAGLGNNVDGLGGAGSQIGEAKLLALPASTDLAQWKSTGFYAAAYTVSGVAGIVDGSTVISYRGTDNLSLDPFSASDIFNGWVAAAGVKTSQSTEALDFYTAVTHASVYDPTQPIVTLTGHSLGGGLAGEVSALTGNAAVVFDYMPFGIIADIIAAENLAAGNAPAGFQLRPGNVTASHTIGEVLQYVRSGQVFQALSSLPTPELDLLAKYLGVSVNLLDPSSELR